ncbi:hypothetical protein PHLCEN_2v12504 [Hermanssonia centrifuga]|uniref:Uncharacterized protein n=1 Tax=Hermanssonia centrifuga TaxID=98765 RepID=A0A2R6NH76_9APHY|nr:hypothetical protein PHLCEN_2v12504 [Hermanssonia centrifuga]
MLLANMIHPMKRTSIDKGELGIHIFSRCFYYNSQILTHLHLISSNGTATDLSTDFICPDGIKVTQAERDDRTLILQFLENSQGCQIAFISIILPVELYKWSVRNQAPHR